MLGFRHVVDGTQVSVLARQALNQLSHKHSTLSLSFLYSPGVMAHILNAGDGEAEAGCEFKAYLVYIASSRLARETLSHSERLFRKTKTKHVIQFSLCIYVHSPCLCSVPERLGQGIGFSWDWSYRPL